MLLPNRFSNDTHTINKMVKYKDRNEDKQYLDKLEDVILDAFKELKTAPTSEWLNNVIDRYRFPNKYKPKPVTLFSFIQDFIDNAPHRINPKTNKPVSYKMIREYHASFGYLKEYAQAIGKEIDFNDIDLEFYDGFKAFLETYRSKTIKNGLALNTVGKKIQTLKIFLNEATARGVNTNLKYQSTRFIAVTEESDNIYLTVEEIEKIYSLDLSDKPKLEKVRDLFVIGCWTGLRYSDWNKVRPENIQEGFVSLKQQKTGQPVVIPLHPTVQAILDKYDGDLPRPITNQKFNEYLKLVAKLADFKEAITKQDIKDLNKDKAILVKAVKGRKKNDKKPGSRSPGNVRKKVNKREQEYVIMTRKLRSYVAEMKKQGKLSPEDIKGIRNKIRNKIFRSKAHLKEYIGGLSKR